MDRCLFNYSQPNNNNNKNNNSETNHKDDIEMCYIPALSSTRTIIIVNMRLNQPERQDGDT
jgi:hypothetical protein